MAKTNRMEEMNENRIHHIRNSYLIMSFVPSILNALINSNMLPELSIHKFP